MKCPKCNLVTFDYLSKCPRCDTSFELSRRLTRRRADPKRRILIASTSAAGAGEVVTPLETGAPPVVATLHTPASAHSSEAPMDAAPETQLAAPEEAKPEGPTVAAEPPQKTPSLREMAETERREDLSVNVAAAVAAARAVVRIPEEQPAPPAAPATAEPQPSPASAPTEAAPSESRTIKERMMRASRARRKERSSLVTESTNPVLPDWYDRRRKADAAGATTGAAASRGSRTSLPPSCDAPRLAMPPASPRRARLAENHGKPSLWVFITDPWCKGAPG